MRLRFVVCII